MRAVTSYVLPVSFILALAAGLGPPASVPAQAACMAGDRVDGTTADQARRKMEAAGFRGVNDLRKGCDNMWHGVALQNGEQTRVVLTPDGQVMKEGD